MLEALRRNTRCALEIIVMHHLGASGDMRSIVDRFGGTYLTYEGPFNFARMNNLAAEKATSPGLLFLNDDVIIQQPAWDVVFTPKMIYGAVGACSTILTAPSNMPASSSGWAMEQATADAFKRRATSGPGSA